ncbi:MAG: hypothetical protein M3Y55_04705 [Pseudomonadota bacterium]|nr:hypothetical protein [Pseudomonadota bacterium]
MNDRYARGTPVRWRAVATALLALAAGAARAQSADAAAPASASATEPSPYYIGASEGLTHDSNVYRVPFGPGDTYSSTSLLGGFDQRLGRQRVFGSGNVSVNRYNDQGQLDNTSYNLAAGLDWETVYDLAGNLNVGLNRQLAAPGATVGVPNPVRNLVQIETVNGRARWGGESLLTLEATAGYTKVDYSAQQYAASDSREQTASFGGYYHPRGPLKLGLAARIVDTRAPQAFLDPAAGTFQSNTVKSNNLDLIADYELTGLLTTHARLSYTKQTSAGSGQTDYSGLTGSLGLAWRATGKIGVSVDLARDAGFDATGITLPGIVPVAGAGVPPAATTAGQYENSRITDSAALRLTYSATAKIDAFAGASYVRARLATTLVGASGSLGAPDTIDSLRSAYIGANYAVARNWGLACNVSHAYRHVNGGGVNYAYNDTSVGCSAQYTLHL